ncbi:TPA: WGR domain-containing protein [Legionella pneumophila]|nr:MULTISPECIES: WGR domain-containing protein [Legionellaceae]MCW8387866.1 WGR domain-containing protein [Fluoribacter dumoffii]MCW8419856.1 WGR domain-containing protein [Fluoribacter dumoffii]MCW8455936.1 WGR domain-containing protein [Fluoribacter dumoffii]MCW8462268.1 WGR domain-containing protein [Fluoribacter dumoffii]MCW8484949.1 WGR domain-containing protein [Fluoribacter dumoffii]
MPWVHYLNFKPKECYHAVRFEKATRYYVIRLEQDLLGDWTLCASNGRIKSRFGQSHIIAFASFSDALKHFCVMVKERNQRGYYLISYQTHDVLYQQILPWACFMEDPAPMKKRPRKKQVRSLLNQNSTIQSQSQDSQQMLLIF